ncbi:MAG: hypothetical protein GEEBNDBF_01337 [bacterium]|nr:hypothetical protein [bacterium]
MPFSWDAIQVVFADANAFSGIWQRHQHFASGLAGLGVGVLYVEEPGNWLTVGRSPEKPASNWTAWRQEPREVGPYLWVWTPPPGVPVGYWSRRINALNHRRYAAAMEQVLGPIPHNRLIFLACNPLAADWLPLIDVARAVYDCCDEFEHFPVPSRRPEVTLDLERRLFQQCDITIFSSAATLRLKAGERQRPVRSGPRMRSPQGSPRRLVQLRNACDPAEFNLSDRDAVPMPADLAPIAKRGPVLLYFGSLAQWFDEALVAGLCKARPDWQVVLLGPPMRPFASLRSLPNCHLLGRKAHGDLPAYAAHASIGILPQLVIRLTSVADHVKVYEYLASGLPVMASPLEELRAFGDLVRTGSSVQEWVTGIEEQLTEDPAARSRRQHYAASQTWLARVQGLRQVLLRPDKPAVDAARLAQAEEEERLLEQLRTQTLMSAQGDHLEDSDSSYATPGAGESPREP